MMCRLLVVSWSGNAAGCDSLRGWTLPLPLCLQRATQRHTDNQSKIMQGAYWTVDNTMSDTNGHLAASSSTAAHDRSAENTEYWAIKLPGALQIQHSYVVSWTPSNKFLDPFTLTYLSSPFPYP